MTMSLQIVSPFCWFMDLLNSLKLRLERSRCSRQLSLENFISRARQSSLKRLKELLDQSSRLIEVSLFEGRMILLVSALVLAWSVAKQEASMVRTSRCPRRVPGGYRDEQQDHDHFHHDTTGDFVRLARHPVLLPPTLVRLIERLRHQSTIRTMVPTTAIQSAYLFPRRPPHRPRTTKSLQDMLTENGLPIRAARNTAMITAAEELPPMVLSDLFGIAPSTAQKWAHYAQATWADYLAHLAP